MAALVVSYLPVQLPPPLAIALVFLVELHFQRLLLARVLPSLHFVALRLTFEAKIVCHPLGADASSHAVSLPLELPHFRWRFRLVGSRYPEPSVTPAAVPCLDPEQPPVHDEHPANPQETGAVECDDPERDDAERHDEVHDELGEEQAHAIRSCGMK